MTGTLAYDISLVFPGGWEAPFQTVEAATVEAAIEKLAGQLDGRSPARGSAAIKALVYVEPGDSGGCPRRSVSRAYVEGRLFTRPEKYANYLRTTSGWVNQSAVAEVVA